MVEGWGDAYPELARAGRPRCEDVLGAEAEQFARTLAQGRRLLDEVIDRSRAGGAGVAATTRSASTTPTASRST